jgi:phage/plasmid-like protein (TIGR03299 family)
MSAETSEWLNSNVLIGCTNRRGNAWHYRADLQTPWSFIDENGDTEIGVGNHYDAGIPLPHVIGRLFAWEALTGAVYAALPTDKSDEAYPYGFRYVEIPNQKRVYPSDDPSHTFWIAKDSYQPHDYSDSLVGAVSDIVDVPGSDLVISSAGLLKQRAIAWVEVSVPDSITTPEGIEFRPNLLATTSLNGTVATTYKRTCTDVVCDNTRSIALAEQGQQFKVKHSRYSNLKLADAREALAIIHTTADDIEAEFAELCRIDVTDKQFYDIIGEITDPPKGKELGKAGTTLKEKKMGELSQLWNNDNRVTPWKGTGYGVIQAVNTWEHHLKGTRRGTTLAERNMLATINGDIEKSDREVYATMMAVLDNV